MPQHIREALEYWYHSGPGHIYASNIRFEIHVLIELAETLFFASLGAEEKEATRVALAWTPNGSTDLKEQKDFLGLHPAWDILIFEEPRPFDVDVVIKTAPLTEFNTSLLVIGGSPGHLFIDGVARRRPSALRDPPLILAADAPGSVTIFYAGSEIFRFERGTFRRPAPDIFTGNRGPVFQTLNKYAESLKLESINLNWSYPAYVARQLADSMRRTQHGGLLLLLPTQEEPNGINLPIKNRGFLKDCILNADRVYSFLSKGEPLPGDEEDIESTRQKFSEATDELKQAVSLVARLSAADNAVLLGPGFSVLGAQFAVSSSADLPDVYEARNETGTELDKYNIRRHGSRHRAAVSFVYEAPGRVALLSSADGPLRCFLKFEDKVLFWQVSDRYY